MVAGDHACGVGMTREQRELLADKLALWRKESTQGNMGLRDYNRRCADALEAALTQPREVFYNLVADARRFDEQFDGDADDYGRSVVSVYYYIELDGHSNLEELCDVLGVPPARYEESLKDRIDRAIEETAPAGQGA